MSDKTPLENQESSERISEPQKEQDSKEIEKSKRSIFSTKFILGCMYVMRAFVEKIYACWISKVKSAFAFYRECQAPIDIKSSHSPYFFHSYKVNVILDCSGIGFLIHDWTIRYFRNETIRQTLTLRTHNQNHPESQMDMARLNTKVPIYILGWFTWKKDFIRISSSIISTKNVDIDSTYVFQNPILEKRSFQNQYRKANIPAYSVRDRFRVPRFRMSGLETEKIQQEFKQEKK